jgi:hypothetical protein
MIDKKIYATALEKLADELNLALESRSGKIMIQKSSSLLPRGSFDFIFAPGNGRKTTVLEAMRILCLSIVDSY